VSVFNHWFRRKSATVEEYSKCVGNRCQQTA
jgi:hypothetical protein